MLPDVDMDSVRAYIAQKYINVRKHPTLDLFIYNYSKGAAMDKFWCHETIACRGLILDGHDNIVARPFKKFFSYDEYQKSGIEPPDTAFEVFDKVDGSLGILYWEEGRPTITTRGNFTSPMSIEGTRILRRKYNDVQFDPSLTYLFEIIYPENRYVIDYGTKRDLVLLAVIDTATGAEMSYDDIVRSYGDTLSIVTRYDGLAHLQELVEHDVDNREGYILRYANGFRMKIKFKTYWEQYAKLVVTNARVLWRAYTGFSTHYDERPGKFAFDKPGGVQALAKLRLEMPESLLNWFDIEAGKIAVEVQRHRVNVHAIAADLTARFGPIVHGDLAQKKAVAQYAHATYKPPYLGWGLNYYQKGNDDWERNPISGLFKSIEPQGQALPNPVVVNEEIE